MSLKLRYRNFVSLFTIAVMLWNVVGWLGTGLILNHAHHDDATFYCEISFCYCETNEGEPICTCHHQNQHDNKDHNGHAPEGDHSSSTCYFTEGHSPQTAASQLVFTSILIAFCQFNTMPFLPPFTTTQTTSGPYMLLDGSPADLLRPPRV